MKVEISLQLENVYVSGHYNISQKKLKNEKMKDRVCIFNGGQECGISGPCVAFRDDKMTAHCGRTDENGEWDLNICPGEKSKNCQSVT